MHSPLAAVLLAPVLPCDETLRKLLLPSWSRGGSAEGDPSRLGRAAAILDGPPPLRPHHLRHTCASLLIAQGIHAKDIQEHLGHSSYGVTMDVYAHLYRDQRSRIAGALQAIHNAGNDEGPGTAAPSSGSDAGS